MNRDFCCALYGITSPLYRGSLEDSVKEMIDGGARIIQYRDKEVSEEQYIRNTERLKELCESNNVVFVVNDYVDVARRLDANLHIGPTEGIPNEIRKNGFGNFLGYSIYGYSELTEAERKGVLDFTDYVGAGLVFFTPLKSDKRPIGTEELARIKEASKAPVFAIGGMNESNIDSVLPFVDGICIMAHKFRNKDMMRKINEYF